MEQQVMGAFCQACYLHLTQDIFAVLTDAMHQPGFRVQVRTHSF